MSIISPLYPLSNAGSPAVADIEDEFVPERSWSCGGLWNSRSVEYEGYNNEIILISFGAKLDSILSKCLIQLGGSSILGECASRTLEVVVRGKKGTPSLSR
jgi:hypothetical protein